MIIKEMKSMYEMDHMNEEGYMNEEDYMAEDYGPDKAWDDMTYGTDSREIPKPPPERKQQFSNEEAAKRKLKQLEQELRNGNPEALQYLNNYGE